LNEAGAALAPSGGWAHVSALDPENIDDWGHSLYKFAKSKEISIKYA
jgi:hypothetical protein